MSASSDDSQSSQRNGVLYPPASLGVVGSGQLGRMFIQAAQRMGYRAGVLAAHADDPAAQVAHWRVIGSSDELADACVNLRREPMPSPSNSKTFRPHALRWLAREPGGAPRLANDLDLPESTSRETVPHPAQRCLTRPGAPCGATPSSMPPSERSVCR